VWWRVAPALVVSLALQVAVNYANDYSDGVRGTDDVRVGPVRLVASGLASPGAVKRAAVLAGFIAAVAGFIIAATTSWWLLVVGVFALVAGWTYTGGPKPYGYLGLGEVFVFVFFGLVATVGTVFAIVESVPVVAWPAAAAVGLLACALLVVNNLRDIPTDREVGKRTLAVRLGVARTRYLYVACVFGAILLGVLCALWRPAALFIIAGVPAALGPARAVLGGASGRELIPVLGMTGRAQLVLGGLLAAGLAVSGLA
jgi:1,4-dihydroxy-2-naphthoate octaprenyltransferase